MRRFFTWFLFASIEVGLLSCSQGKGHTDTNPEGAPEGPSFSLTDFDTEYDSSKLVTWMHGPFTGKSAHNRLRLTFVKKNGEVVSPERNPRFWPYMSIHGHGSTKNGNGMVSATAEPHVYEVSEFIFTMGGKWELEVRVSLEGKAYSLSIPVHVPEA